LHGNGTLPQSLPPSVVPSATSGALESSSVMSVDYVSSPHDVAALPLAPDPTSGAPVPSIIASTDQFSSPHDVATPPSTPVPSTDDVGTASSLGLVPTVPRSASTAPTDASSTGLASAPGPDTSTTMQLSGSSTVPSALASSSILAHVAPRTRLQDGIHKLKQFTDGTIHYAFLTSPGVPYNM
jgi:hypothetical protein